MDAFEPPKYLTSLIAAVNDGAKSAQTAAVAFTLFGLYLCATAFSTTDEDLLLQHTMSVSQIGVQVPVAFSFAIAPVVFVLLHVYSLIRYDMLASNLHQFRVDVRTSVTLEADRERCRQLLANVEFVQVITAPASSQLYSRLYQVMTWLVLAWFPIATLIAVQISSLRFQSTTATTTQQICVAFDLLIIFWFINRQREREITSEKTFSQRSLYSLIYLLITAILVFDFIYLNVPDADELTVRRDDGSRNWSLAYQQPIDFALCRPSLQWGCRYLTIDHRTLVGKLWKPDLIAELITFPEDISKALALVEGVYLRDRELRFAKLDESRLYAADLRGADLRGATLVDTHLQGAKLDTANLVGANLTFADLRGARLTGANLTETVLKQAILESTYLTEANLARANLTGAKVIRARLYKAVIIDADLTGADLTGAYLLEANLQNANLTGANVTGATFIEGNLTGADLTRADLTGADLSGTNLDRSNLTNANLSAANLAGVRNLSQRQLDLACGDASTALPEGLKMSLCK